MAAHAGPHPRTCSPGKTAKLILPSMSYGISLPFLSTERTPFRKKIIAPRGPRSDLWVVVVTTSECSKRRRHQACAGGVRASQFSGWKTFRHQPRNRCATEHGDLRDPPHCCKQARGIAQPYTHIGPCTTMNHMDFARRRR